MSTGTSKTKIWQNNRFWGILIGRHVTFQLTLTWYHFKAYRHISPSQWLVHLSQRIQDRKLTPKDRAFKTCTLLLAIQGVTRHVTL